MFVCWKSDGYSCGKSIYQIFEALSLYTILFNYSTFYLDLLELRFLWFSLSLTRSRKYIKLIPCSDEFLAFREKLQRRQRIRMIFQQFPQCRSPPPPCPPPSARPYSSWSSRHISRLGEMKELRARMQVRDYTSITSADAWSIVI